MMLRRICLFLGCWLTAVGLGQIAWGTRAIPGGGPSNAAIDSQTRAAGVLAAVCGMVQVWAVRKPRPQTLRGLSLLMAALAGARLTAIPTHGRLTGAIPVAIATEATSSALLLAYSVTAERHSGA
ncbi:DUF4345 domain-containing protein [Mycobacterium sp. CBMA271]|uniref:DUF4345 family protein n=1 Tax=unclassified Mycobacteroides TaxID=2618759 RepID=UPI0012DE2088|nr:MULTISPECIES: DUF4345 family protein [unclassified Mycobacteroides]MUM18093.1 hypothetical protein [Mycobacteroides sp. CBMA 326]MUM23422.1 DUF4345 domain-containing protein [Mycobacteroides sp. CBMA 271]